MIVQGNYRKGVVVVSSNCNIAPSLHSLILFTSTTSNTTCEISHSKISASCYICVGSDLSIIMFWLSNLRWPQTMGQWLKYLVSHGPVVTGLWLVATWDCIIVTIGPRVIISDTYHTHNHCIMVHYTPGPGTRCRPVTNIVSGVISCMMLSTQHHIMQSIPSKSWC